MININGIDISEHNGIINWSLVKQSGIKFAICRAGYGNSVSQIDKKFQYNITNALAQGIDVGAYWFSYAVSPEDAKMEWQVCKQIISPYKSKMVYPIAFDYEYDSYDYYVKQKGNKPSNSLVNEIVMTFVNAAKADGYKVMIYTNNDYARNIFTSQILNSCDIWFADYSGSPDRSCAIQQTKSNGRINGISTNVDLDTCFKTYTNSFVDVNYCDTTSSFTKNLNDTYMFKTGSAITCGDGHIWTSISQKIDKGYYYTTFKAIGKGSAGFYVNGIRKTIGTVK